MRPKGILFRHCLVPAGIFLLFTLSPFPTTAAAPDESHSSEAIIRSIGFRNCPSSSTSSSALTGPVASSNAIHLTNLALLYDGQSNTISLKADGSTEKELDATSAHVLLTAYDRVFYDQRIDLAKVAPFIPRFKGRFSFQETFSAPDLLPTTLPKQLFTFPAVEAVASIQLFDTKGTPLLCTSVPLTNTVSAQSPIITIASVSLTAAAVALTALTSLVASFSSAAILTSMPLAQSQALSASSSSLSPSVWDVVSFCQFVAMTGSLNLDYPELLQQWTQNFGWSMGMVQGQGWNEAIEGLRTRTSRFKTEGPMGSHAGAVESGPRSEKVLYSGSVGSRMDKSLAQGHNNTVVALSMQSMMNGAVKSLIEKAVLKSDNQTQSAISQAKLVASKMHLTAKRGSAQFSRRQEPAAPAPAPEAAPAVPVAPSAPDAPAAPMTIGQLGAALLPSAADTSLMNHLGDLSSMEGLDALPSTIPMGSIPTSVSPTPIGPQPTPPESWPHGYHPSTTNMSQPGLTSFGHRLNIPAKNMFMTSLFLFMILLLTTSLVALFVRIGLEVYAYYKPGKFTKLRRRFSAYYLGNMLRVVLLAYFAVATLAFYQLTLKDAWPMTLLAVITLLLFMALVTFITLRLRRAGGTSLFFDERLKSKYGVLYDQYVLSAYLFFVPVLLYQILKAAIVGLCQDSEVEDHGSSDSWAQMSLLLLVEASFAALMIWRHPFSDKTPNRLNGFLGCVRVFNVVMLAVLVEGAAVSTVSRTVVGIIITITQALMMLVLACLIFYQLGKALWRLRTVLKADPSKTKKEYKQSRSEFDEEVVIISVKDDKDHDPPGRSASEQVRAESMTSLVGMMGIGQNPTIRYTPASDDEDDGDDDDHADVVMPRAFQAQPSPEPSMDPSTDQIRESARNSLRDSTQSNESRSSHILDYYNPAYLPSSIRQKLQEPNATAEAEQNFGQAVANERRDSLVAGDRNSLVVPGAIVGPPGEPWVQAAYMTRRKSESSAHLGQGSSSTESLVSSSGATAAYVDGQRKRPLSVGGVRESLGAMTFSAAVSPTFDDTRRRSDRRASIASDTPSSRPRSRIDSLPVLTMLPESLLAGPPPPSMQPRRTSVSSATLATPPSMSPVLPTLAERMRGERTESISSSPSSPVEQPVIPVVSSAPNFSTYRFPDERQPLEGTASEISRTIAAQRNIHPLSPFHPDYQHPDDVYKPGLPSPNEAGPGSTLSHMRLNHPGVLPIPVSSARPADPTPYTNPNMMQDGSGSRRESRSPSISNLPSISITKTAAAPPLSSSSSRPKLTIVTTPLPTTPAPQIPLPVLPPTPFTALVSGTVLSGNISSASGPTPSTSLQQQQQQPTPTSTSEGSSLTLVPTSERKPSLGTPMTMSTTLSTTTTTTTTSTLTSVVDCSLAGMAPNGFSPNRQRALSTTPLNLPAPGRPMTVSRNQKPSRAGR